MNLKNKTRLLAALLVVGILASTMTIMTNALPTRNTATTKTQSTSDIPPEVEQLKAQLPATLADAEAKILVVRGRYLMWTHDLQHIMWGRFGGGYFVGTDNVGKQAWGIYGRGFFAGFYDGQFFWGRFNGAYWKAQGLFGLNAAYGRYTTYPLVPVISSVAP